MAAREPSYATTTERVTQTVVHIQKGGTGRTSSEQIFFGRPRFFFGGCPLTN